jgi:hypothetical protein
MKRGIRIASSLLAIAVVAIAPAQAASTRAEYITQVDPMCRANLGPWQQTYAAEVRTFKKWARLTNKGTLKAWVDQTHEFARALERHVQVHNTLTDQISAVPPPPEDAQLVARWLMLRNEYERLTQSAAQALHVLDIGQWGKQYARANKVGDTEWDVAASLGLLDACK